MHTRDTVTQHMVQDTPLLQLSIHSTPLYIVCYTFCVCTASIRSIALVHSPLSKRANPTHAITGSIAAKGPKASKQRNTHRERGSETITFLRHENRERIRTPITSNGKEVTESREAPKTHTPDSLTRIHSNPPTARLRPTIDPSHRRPHTFYTIYIKLI